MKLKMLFNKISMALNISKQLYLNDYHYNRVKIITKRGEVHKTIVWYSYIAQILKNTGASVSDPLKMQNTEAAFSEDLTWVQRNFWRIQAINNIVYTT